MVIGRFYCVIFLNVIASSSASSPEVQTVVSWIGKRMATGYQAFGQTLVSLSTSMIDEQKCATTASMRYTIRDE